MGFEPRGMSCRGREVQIVKANDRVQQRRKLQAFPRSWQTRRLQQQKQLRLQHGSRRLTTSPILPECAFKFYLCRIYNIPFHVTPRQNETDCARFETNLIARWQDSGSEQPDDSRAENVATDGCRECRERERER
ncbi:unnamed protein product, partial [Effrenium voratum]